MSLFNDASLITTPNGVKAGKLFSVKPFDGSGDFTWVRNTSATRVNENGLIETVGANVPRLDYSNGGCPCILVEPQRTNLLLRSEEFENASWVKTATTISQNVIIAPDGTLTADKIIENTANSIHTIRQTVSTPANTIFSISIFAKKSERSIIYVGGLGRTPNSNEGYVWFDLNLGIVLSSIGGFSGEIHGLDDGWFKVTVKTVASPTSTQREVRVGCSNADGIQSYTGDGTSGIYIWGAQLEVGSNATSYIPTVASAVTRNADVGSKTGVADLIGQTEGTLFLSLSSINESAQKYITLSNGTNSQRIIFAVTSLLNQVRVQLINSISQVEIFYTVSNIQEKNSFIFSYKENNFKFYVNGILVGSDTSGTTNVGLNTFELQNPGNILRFTGKIYNMCLFKTQLTDAECIALTTI